MSLLAALLAAATVVCAFAPAARADGTYTPVADSYVDASAASSNFGTATSLQTDGSPLKRIFMKFDLTAAGAPSSAALRIYANSDNPTGFTVRAVSDTTWGETTITHDNAPVIGAVVASSGPITKGNWYTLDITPIARAGTSSVWRS